METFLHDLPQIWLSNLVVDLRRYIIFAVAVFAILWVVLSAPLRRRKLREDSPPPRQMGLEFLMSLRSIAIFSTIGVSMSLLSRLGAYPLSDQAHTWGPVWFGASLALMILGHDAYYYWVHRVMHQPRFFRTFHRRHHKSHNPSPFTAYSFDIREAFMMASFVLLWPLIVPTPWGVVGLFMLHQIFRNTMLHSGYELMPARADGRPMLDWLTTTTHHDLHHAQAGYNYGLYFTWWDRWMKTEHPEYQARYAQAAWRPFARRTGIVPAE
ncbi:MAG: sterol desaturase family protein [Alphaproteobacteria bacterium]|nr:sterol desaturase family protein [Alphaproteobacteria bacterium]MBU1516168.1 sterol desaturase family protein [Alphaproteobacteria bacterium]MBU2097117.1 sterol desaturase family protein [Alphaproteobacteria bacterium]MBU2151565.1 sterol desaturase family protein [Alphaproteobacteria bacterium]MBU2309686.1 sterol desaturase family protein [Alphaproteobacteria bacterium]